MYIPFISTSTTWRNYNSNSGKHQASCRRIHKLFQNENCYWSQNAGHALVLINNKITLKGTSQAFKWKGRSSKWSFPSFPFEQFPCTCGSLKTLNKPEPGKLSKDRKTRQSMKESEKRRRLKQLQAERGDHPHLIELSHFILSLRWRMETVEVKTWILFSSTKLKWRPTKTEPLTTFVIPART